MGVAPKVLIIRVLLFRVLYYGPLSSEKNPPKVLIIRVLLFRVLYYGPSSEKTPYISKKSITWALSGCDSLYKPCIVSPKP